MNEDLLVDITSVYNVKVLLDKTCEHYNNGTKSVKDAKLIIPAYQRLYSWDAGNFAEFIETISEYKSGSCNTQKFLGQIILHYNENGDFEIVDGQQRFTTLTILAHLIYNDSEVEKKQDIKSFLFMNNDESTLRLSHQIVNARVFEEYILLRKSEHTVNKNIIEILDSYNDKEIDAAECRKKLVSVYSKSRGHNSYKKDHYHSIVTGYTMLSEFYNEIPPMVRSFVIQKIKDHLYFSILRSNSFDMAYESFMSLNAKGRPLSAFDLVKSVFIGASGSESDSIEKNWDDKIEYTNLNPSKLVDILEIMIKVEYLDLCNEIYVNKAVDFKHSNLHHIVKSLINHIDANSIFNTYVSYIDQYMAIENGNISSLLGSTYQEFNNSAMSLIKMDYKPFLPILFSYINNETKNKSELHKIINIAKYAPFLYVTVANGRPTVLNNIVLEYLESNDTEDNKLQNLYNNFNSKMPYINFVHSMCNNVLLKKNEVSKDLLLLLEPGLGTNDKYENQLEHIFPQKFKIKEWDEFKDNKEAIYNIGNHVIIPAELNKKIKNNSYKVKKELVTNYNENIERFEFINEAFGYTKFSPEIVGKRAKTYSKNLESKFREMGLLKDNNV